ncbi:HupE/UreJ family protein [Psychromarinibacter sp. S121]|uniref:HupE/UreJ family protein n=1 Tax=Psychromarinibacter sp. S121 TaxID=3415127 RepID=UPI003C7C39D3
MFGILCEGVQGKLARWRWLSTLVVLSLAIVIGRGAAAHEIRPAISDVLVEQDRVQVFLSLTLEPMLAGIDLEGLDDTDNAPEADRYDRFRAMGPDELDAAFRAAWPELSDGFLLMAGDTPLEPEIRRLEIPEAGDLSLPRDSSLLIAAALPDDGSDVTVGWVGAYGPLVIRQREGGDDAYSALLEGGQVSVPLPRTGAATETAGEVFSRFIVQGFEHIIPKGLDHIVFVLGLFFFSLQFRPLLTQVTAFTLAHTVTLALASLGIVRIPAGIVEPLIAASIVFVGVENILRPQLGVWRTAVVFLFGLLHGLGFASVLGELGGGGSNFFARLIGFNIGVELGQLTVIALAFLTVGYWFGRKPWYRARIAIPASVLIALIGAFWFVERVV